MEHRTHAVVDSPVGPITIVAQDGLLAGLYLDRSRHPPTVEMLGEPDPAPTAEVAAQLAAYFDGRLTEFDLPMTLIGTPFQQRVWAELLKVPFGETTTYLRLAEAIGQPTASRAVGMANGRNPISIIVPCHRVVGSSGDLTGYGGGLHRKRHLLDFERRVAGTTLDLALG